ncbi:transposase domain-containing protein, partial [Jeotgalibaca porci]
ASGVVYSLIQTAKLNGLDPYKYLNYFDYGIENVPLVHCFLPGSAKKCTS